MQTLSINDLILIIGSLGALFAGLGAVFAFLNEWSKGRESKRNESTKVREKFSNLLMDLFEKIEICSNTLFDLNFNFNSQNNNNNLENIDWDEIRTRINSDFDEFYKDYRKITVLTISYQHVYKIGYKDLLELQDIEKLTNNYKKILLELKVKKELKDLTLLMQLLIPIKDSLYKYVPLIVKKIK